MSKYFVLVFIGFIAHMKCAFSQDTLVFNNRAEFNRFIEYSFTDAVNQLTPQIKNKIDSIFKTYDFSGEEYRCQYGFGVIVDFDTCGIINNCLPGNNDETGKLPEFINEVCLAVANSNIQIPNKIIFEDTTYIFQSAIFTFEISCDPDEIIFYADYSNKDLIGYCLKSVIA